MFTTTPSVTAALAILASGAFCMPTGTTCDKPARVAAPPTGVTHIVVAGANGQLRFEPESVIAAVGDIVEFRFHPKNHSVAQSSFAEPCAPLAAAAVLPPSPLPAANGTGHYPLYSRRGSSATVADNNSPFFAGFDFATAEGPWAHAFQVLVQDTKPVWLYCPQPMGAHCTNGMSGVINEPRDGPNTLAAYRQAAKGKMTIVPPRVQGGKKVAKAGETKPMA
ncbi:plastocyanin-like domain-containing protein [Apiospora marii]|uniref:Plastocyanin-like domain-containing protein n=1 Tax=Apiospora marii TaxID=335849 RepID=A0ABR1S834_9PEZI